MYHTAMSYLQEAEQHLRKELDLGESKQAVAKVDFPHSKIIKDASLEIAAEFDQNGQWDRSTDHYYTVMTTGKTPLDRAEGFIGLAQNYINLVNYDVAENLLKESFTKIKDSLTGWEQNFYQARVWEKLGWIYDYYGKPEEATPYFKRAINILEEKAMSDDKILRIYETSNHFLGRQYVIMASQGKSPAENIKQAINRFQKSLEIYQKFREKENDDPVAEGFQYAWLTRCHLLLGQLDLAEKDLKQMRLLFEEHKKLYPGSGVLGYYYLLLGRLKIERNQPDEARKDFAEALRINREVVQYKASQADALYSLAICALMKNQKDQAKALAEEAIKLNPNLLVRGFI